MGKTVSSEMASCEKAEVVETVDEDIYLRAQRTIQRSEEEEGEMLDFIIDALISQRQEDAKLIRDKWRGTQVA